jgi:hypothetical protein
MKPTARHHMNSNPKNAGQGELALIDRIRVVGLSIFAAFVFTRSFFSVEAQIIPPENQAQVLVHSTQAHELAALGFVMVGVHLHSEPDTFSRFAN